MNDFAEKVAGAKDLTIDEQKKVGTPVQGDLNEEHKKFLTTLKTMLKNEEIDPYDPKSFLKLDVYESLDEQQQDKADLALQNIAAQLRRISEFLASQDTPDESPQLQTMVDQLWQSKQAIEQYHDVFKF